MIVIDQLSCYSRLRYINIEEKAVYMLTALILCIAGRSIAFACLLLGVNTFLTVRKGGVPFFRYGRLMKIPILFLIPGTAAVMVSFSRTPMDAFAVPLGSFYLTGGMEDVLFSIRLFLSALSCVSCLYFFTLSTPVTDFWALLQKLKLPSIFIELMLLIYRFIFILMDTAQAIRTSQDSRLGNRNYRTSLHSFGHMGSALFIRAMKRSSALYDAMESRCYDGKISVLTEDYPAKRNEIIAIILFECLSIIIILAEQWYLPI